MIEEALLADNMTALRSDQAIFSQLSFAAKPGELLQIVGPNGCGKTTLLRSLAGLVPLEQGSIHWQGKDIQQSRAQYHADFIYLGHSTGIKQGLTAFENLTVNCTVGKPSSATSPLEALKRLGLANKQLVLARDLSAGQKQRLALAQLLILNVKLWLLDEPFTALDRDGIDDIQSIFQQHLQQGGMIILTTHQPLAIGTEVKQIELGAG